MPMVCVSGTFLFFLKESHGNWYALPYGDPTAQLLSSQFSVRGIPALKVPNIQRGYPVSFYLFFSFLVPQQSRKVIFSAYTQSIRIRVNCLSVFLVLNLATGIEDRWL